MTKVKLITIQIPSMAPSVCSYELLNREFPQGGGSQSARHRHSPSVWLCFNFQINYQGTPSPFQSRSWKLENGGFA